MKSQQKPKPEIYDVYDDEIDLFELFRKIWKWKWLTASIILIICGATFSYIKYSPYTYTSTAVIRVGKIAGLPIEQKTSLDNHLSSDGNKVDKICIITSTITVLKTDAEAAALVEIKSISSSPEHSIQCVEQTNKNFLLRHKIIYEKAIKKLNDNIASVKRLEIIRPEYFLDTYTFPTSIIKYPEKPTAPDSKKLPVKMAVAFFASLFFGIFLSFFIDYILTHIKGKK